MEALKAASHRKRFGCGLKRAALLSGRRLFSVGPIIGIAFATKRAPVLKTHLRAGRKEASESAGRHPLLKAGPSRRKTTTLCCNCWPPTLSLI